MDLRLQLIKRQCLLSLLVLGIVTLLMSISLRTDVARELEAASRTAELIGAVAELSGSTDPGRGLERLKAMLDEGGFRHISVAWRGTGAPPMAVHDDSLALRFLKWMADDERDHPERVIARGTSGGADWAIVVRPDPKEELREVLRDFLYVLGVLFVFSLLMLLMTGLVADRALRPVRDIIAGLSRIEAGDLSTRVQRPELREYAQISAAVDRLSDSLALSRANERKLGRRLIELQERERRDLAVELHDEFGQSLTAISANAGYLMGRASGLGDAGRSAAEDIGREARRILGHVRALLTQLKPHGLEGFALRATLAELVDAWRQRAPEMAIEFVCDDDVEELGQRQALVIYRGLQEGLTNVIRHARASRCSVVLRRDLDWVRLEVEDNGSGRVENARDTDGAGLLGLRERAAMIGGNLDLEQVHPSGWRLIIRLPADEFGDGDADPAQPGTATA